MQQILKVSAKIAPAAPTLVSMTLANRRNTRIDRLAVSLRAVPQADGTVPTRDQLELLERLVHVRLSTDAQQRNQFTPQGIPVSALQSREIGPVPIAPFVLEGSEQFTVEWSAPPNAFQMVAYTAASEIFVDVVMWGVDER